MSNFLQCARYTDRKDPLPHQDAAWHWAWQQFPDEKRAEFLEMFRAAPARKPTGEPEWLEIALTAIRRFEGCRLDAYNDAVRLPTIGYGTRRYPNGIGVKIGDRITQAEAETFLRNDVLNVYGLQVQELLPESNSWAPHQIAAIVSFTYNVGCRALETSTLRARLKAGERPEVVIPEELPRWNKGDGEVLEGLTKRREAEVRLFLTGSLDASKPEKPSAPQAPVRGNPLVVPWFSQRDSGTDQGARMCFSSSCAMVVAFMKPGALSGPNGDDQYLHRLQQYGDTTDPKAQIRTLSSFGIKATFTQKADFALIESQINRGVPVPCGYLHRGSIDAPGGGGHWLLVVGYDKSHVIVHDPWGEADLITGQTVSSSARYCRYSRKNFGKRWMAEGPGTGWALVITPSY